MRHRPTDDGPNGQRKRLGSGSAESIAFTLLAGIALGLLVGYGLDRLLRTSPAFLLVGVFAGFAAALYAIYLETK